MKNIWQQRSRKQTFVGPHLEYANSVWLPHLRKYKKMLDNIQIRGTKLVDGMKTIMPGSDGRQECLSRRDFHSFSPLAARLEKREGLIRSKYTRSVGTY